MSNSRLKSATRGSIVPDGRSRFADGTDDHFEVRPGAGVGPPRPAISTSHPHSRLLGFVLWSVYLALQPAAHGHSSPENFSTIIESNEKWIAIGCSLIGLSIALVAFIYKRREHQAIMKASGETEIGNRAVFKAKVKNYYPDMQAKVKNIRGKTPAAAPADGPRPARDTEGIRDSDI